MFAGSPSKVATVNPAHSASAASSVKSLRPSRAARRWASRITSNRNACGVCAMRSRARSGVASTFPLRVDQLDGVGDRQSRGSPRRCGRRPRSRAKSAPPRRMAAPRRGSGRCPASGRRALRARHAPRPAASRRRWRAARGASALTASLNIAVSSGFRTGCTAKICGWRQNGSIARKITVCPPIERYCFGPPEPARRPRPAATRMAAVRSGFGIGLNWRFKGLMREHGLVGALPLSCRGAKTERFPIAVGKAYFVAVHLQDCKNCLKCRHEA